MRTLLVACAALLGMFVLAVMPAQAALKAPTQGLLDRQKMPVASHTSAVRNFVVSAYWNQVEPNRGTFVWTSVDNGIAQAKAAGMRVMLRVQAGGNSPAWVKSLVGTVTITTQQGTSLAVPRFWRPTYDVVYRELMAAMAARYDLNPAVGVVDVPECMVQYEEPYLREAGIPGNAQKLLAAGYTLAADKACHTRELHAGLDFLKATMVRLAFNPYQSIDATGTVKMDEAYTETMMAAFRALGGARAMLGNDSISSTRMNEAGYNSMYAKQKLMGPPIGYQTATAAKIGDWQATLRWADAQGANCVELPRGYDMWSVTILKQYASLLAANPTSR